MKRLVLLFGFFLGILMMQSCASVVYTQPRVSRSGEVVVIENRSPYYRHQNTGALAIGASPKCRGLVWKDVTVKLEGSLVYVMFTETKTVKVLKVDSRDALTFWAETFEGVKEEVKLSCGGRYVDVTGYAGGVALSQ